MSSWPNAGEPLTIIELFRDFYVPHPDEATLRRHLAAPIAIRDHVEKEKQLRALLAREAGESRLSPRSPRVS